MKNNRITRLAILVLALTMITLMIVSGTFAKYTSTATGSDTATVAKWSIKVGTGDGVEIAGSSSTVSFDLFSTIKDEDGNSEDDVAGKASNIAVGSTAATAKIIAPGTSGSFDLIVKNESEVNATYSITFNSDNTNIPIEFSTDNGEHWDTTLSSANITNQAINMNSAAQTKTVKWRWAYNVSEARDTSDTNLGVAAQTSTASVTLSATITATQAQ